MNDNQPYQDVRISVRLMGTQYDDVIVVRSVYHLGGTALQLQHEGEPLATATVWLDVPPAKGCVWIKDWSENEGVFDSLVEAGVIEETGAVCHSGYVTAREGRLL
jgi:hypothetical protein